MTAPDAPDLAERRERLLLWPLPIWPELDRLAWEAAVGGFASDGPLNPASAWSPCTRDRNIDAYGRYLSWLAREGLLIENEAPAGRIRRDRVSRFLSHMRGFLASASIGSTVGGLAMAARAVAPDSDWQWLSLMGGRLKLKAKPVRNKKHAMRHSTELYELGLHIMDTASLKERRQVFVAQRYMAGLMIALLAARPLRVRNFKSITVGKSLRWDGKCYWLTFSRAETKAGQPIDEPIPDGLAPYLETYLRLWRPRLLRQAERFGVDPTHRCLWVGRTGKALSEACLRLYIERYTAQHFGTHLWPHLFRDCLLTSLADDRPDLMGIGATLLGHASNQTGEKYYNQARMKAAGRRFSSAIASLRDSFMHPETPCPRR